MIAQYFNPAVEAKDAESGGIRLVAACAKPNLYACASLANRVSVTLGGETLLSIGMQKFAVKSRSEGKVQRIALSHEGERLFVASAIFITCIDVATGAMEWQYRPSRMFGFLRNTPLDMVVCDDGGALMTTSSGNIIRLDRKGRVDFNVFDNDSPQSLSRLAGDATFVGGDGHVVHSWSADDGSRVRSKLYVGRHYAVAACRDTVAVRIPHAHCLVPLADGGESTVLPCGQGLPSMAWSPDGQFLAFIEDAGLRVIDRQGHPMASLAPQGSRVISLAALFDEPGFIVGCADGTIQSVRV